MFFSVFLRFLLGSEGLKILGVLGGFPWFLPKHQGMEDQGVAKCYMRLPPE